MKNKILVFLCFIGIYANCQTVAGVDTLWKTGPINKRINLVLMGDGYTTAQIPQFINNATTTYTYLLNQSPFNNYKNYFNVFAIKCESPQTGVSHPATATDVTEPVIPISSVTNYFNTRFDNYSIHRLLYSMNSSAVYSVLSAWFPAYDQAVILGNSTEYGGAGGAYAVSSINSSAREIVAHEIGHSFAGLSDEYWAGASYAAEKPNLTANTNTATVKWTQWLGTNSIGLYPHGTAAPESNWYRPHQNCKMRYLNQPFCSVCKQTIIEKIHSLTNPIDSYLPTNASAISFTTTNQWFKTTLVKPNPNTLKRTWKLNSVIIANNIDSLLLANSSLNAGNNSLLFTVMDTTLLSRDVNHAALHSYSVLWTINNSVTGISTITPQLEFQIFPNPASNIINVKYNVLEESEVSISIVDMMGRTVIDNRSKKQAVGEYQSEIEISKLNEGNYFLSIKINAQTINNQFVILK